MSLGDNLTEPSRRYGKCTGSRTNDAVFHDFVLKFYAEEVRVMRVDFMMVLTIIITTVSRFYFLKTGIHKSL